VVREDLGIEQVVDLFRERGLSRVPVVNEEGTLVGIMSKTDLVEELYMRGDTEEVDQSGADFGQHVHVIDHGYDGVGDRRAAHPRQPATMIAEHGMHDPDGMPESLESVARDSRSIEGLVEHVRELPLADQLELLRRITPVILGDLDDDARNELVSDLNQAIAQQRVRTARVTRR